MKHIDILTLEQLIAERGLNVDIEEIEIVKNSVPCKGIRIIRSGKEEISPVVYYSASDTLENICKKIADAVALQGPEFNLELLKDPTYFADNAYIAVVRHNGESKEVISKTYFNLDMIMKLYIIGNPEDSEHGSVKVTERLLNELGILEEDAWDLAMANSCESASVISMAEALGFSTPDDCGMLVASCNRGQDGAAIICFPEIFREYCIDHDVDSLILLPSSTQELVVLHDSGNMIPDDLLNLVRTINATEVDPLIQLTPAVYRYSLADNEITILSVDDKGVI